MMRRLLALFAVLGLFALAAPAGADQFRPAYLQIEQAGTDEYALLWKVPALDETTTMSVSPVLPRGTRELSPRSSSYAAGALVSRWRIRAPGGIEGKPLSFSGLSQTGLDVLVRYRRADGTEQIARATGAAPTVTLESSPGPWEVVVAYTGIGIWHILSGVDHLLFVLTLVLLVDSLRRLLVTVTAFTLAHSITLALATLGVIHVPGPPVEASIALSIVFVAAEVLQRGQGRRGLASRKPWIIAFGFGLLHGLGFAGALAEVGLPRNDIPLSLLFFNVGVEIGQLAFIAAVLLLGAIGGWLIRNIRLRQGLVTAGAYAIGATASFWVLDRIAQF
jgi:hydrogenase/urease accessory protein HupE